MIIYVDIDNTICHTEGTDYNGAKPIRRAIDYINSLYDYGYNIIYWTSRGVGSNTNQYDLTKNQLDSWGCKYHSLKCDKPVYDLFVDDKAFHNIDDLSKNIISKINKSYIELNRIKNIIPKLNLYKNKKICLLGCGLSLEKYKINFNDYDLVVGANRIYKTEYCSHINVLYYNLSKKDNCNDMLKHISLLNNIKYIVFCPWSSGPKRRMYLEQLLNVYKITNHLYCKFIVRGLKGIKRRPLTGMAALNHIIYSGASEIDIYGFDFYEEMYINNLTKFDHDKYHDIESNKNFFLNLMQQYPNQIKWNK